jgi:RNA polymerase sigma-70 factor (ECF subfamily)
MGIEHMWQNEASPGRLIERARCGDETARGELLELYRNYLRLVARSMVGSSLRGQLEHSDLVQETFLKAHRDFTQFAGESERELVAWLRQILVRSLANQVKHNRRQVRNDQRQESLEQLLEQSNLAAKVAITAHTPSPSEVASDRERAVLLADAIDRLPVDYREAFVLRTLEHVPFEEVAIRMGRSTGAVRMLWARAVKRLNQMLEGES